MGMPPKILKEIVEAGVNVIIIDKYPPSTLKEIVSIAVKNNSQVIIKDQYPPNITKELAETYGNKITFIV
jgi:hypothetical protein